MKKLDKNPDSDDGDDLLDNVQLLGDHAIFKWSWIQKRGRAARAKLADDVIDSEQHKYIISATLHAMIQSLTKNYQRMCTRMGPELGEDAADGQPHVCDKSQCWTLEGWSMRRDARNSSSSGDGDTSTSG